MSSKYVPPEKLLADALKRLDQAARSAQRPISAATVPCGVVSSFAGDTAPEGYLLCQGQAVSRTTYAKLFALIGTTYGAGNGTTTFNVPDLRGRAPVGLNTADTEFNTLGKKFGAKTHTLTTSQIPNLTASSAGSHSHTGTAASGGAHTHGFGGRAVISTEAGVNLYTRNSAPGSMPTISMADSSSTSVTEPTATSSGGAHTHTVSTVSAGAHTHTVNSGGGGSHNNIQPSLTLNFIIKV